MRFEEFQKVAAKYGDPYRTEARYFVATNMLYLDRDKSLAELAELFSVARSTVYRAVQRAGAQSTSPG